jgi:hypothetical protein
VVGFSNETKIKKHSFTQETIFESKWCYEEVDIIDRFGFLIFIYSQPIRTVTATFLSSAWDLGPTDIFQLTHHIFDGQKFMVRSVVKNLQNFTTQIHAWDLGNFSFKDWAEDAATDPTDYDNALLLTYNIWHADNEIFEGFNDEIEFDYAGVPVTASLTVGSYESGAAIAEMLTAQMNAAVLANGSFTNTSPVTVTYNTTSRKYNIANAVGADGSIIIYWYDGTHLKTKEIGRSLLGFDPDTVANNSTIAAGASDNSDYLCILDIEDGEAAGIWS